MAKQHTSTNNTDSTITAADVEQGTAEQNMATILAIPHEQCPWPFVRHQLLQWALAGADIRAYKPLMSRQYVIYHRHTDGGPLAECRFTPREWALAHGYDVGDGSTDGTGATDGKEAC